MQIALTIKMVFLATRFKLVNIVLGDLNLLVAFRTRIIDYAVGLALVP